MDHFRLDEVYYFVTDRKLIRTRVTESGTLGEASVRMVHQFQFLEFRVR